MDDTKEGLEVWLAKEVEGLGLDPVVLKDAVQRELTLRAAKRIATNVEKAAHHRDGDDWVVA